MAPSPPEYRIALLGDSYTLGEGVGRTEDTFAQVLEDTLNRRHPGIIVRVFNFQASAYSVKEMVASLKHRAPAIDPDFVVMSRGAGARWSLSSPRARSLT